MSKVVFKSPYAKTGKSVVGNYTSYIAKRDRVDKSINAKKVEINLRYIATRPRVEKVGEHGLFGQVAEALGAKVDWDGEKQLVTISNENLKIEITIGKDIASVNGKEIKLDSSAFIENDRTYLPLRFVAENLGAEVEWVEETKQVVITKALPEKTTTK